MSIIIGADIVPVQSNIEYFEKAQIEELIGKELCDILNKADYRIFNLEVPLVNLAKPINKNGPHLISSAKSIAGMKAMGINLFSLANNHIMDHDVQGLVSTIQVLKENGISYVGAGLNLQKACAPFYFNIKGKRYGVYACAEHEFSIADQNKPGANPFNALESIDHIKTIKNECDYSIVLYHGGKENYRYPSPYLQKICRKIVEKGADLVICQHSHCIGSMEKYQNGTIVYGQGNFLFSKYENEYWRTGLLIEIDDDLEIKYYPITKKEGGICLADKIRGKEILQDFYTRSQEIQKSGFIEERYKTFANECLYNYIAYIIGIRKSYVYRIINRLLGSSLYNRRIIHYLKNNDVELLNYVECEAHRDLLIEGLKAYESSK